MKKPHRKNNARLDDTAGLQRGTSTPDGPVRQCAVTRERLAQAEALRFVRSPDGVVTPDVAGKLPGRGVWITATRDTLSEAIRTGAFRRGFKSDVQVPDGLVDSVETLLVKRCQGVLGMAKRGGNIVLGYDQVREALRKERPGYLLEAADGREDGRGKVYFLAKALYEDVKVAGALTSAELGMAFGRERVIHGLVRKVAVSKAFAVAYRRLAGFRDTPESHWFSDKEPVAANRQTQDARSGPECDM